MCNKICTIVLISCVKSKLTHRARAQDLYISDLFCKSLAYAQSLDPDAIYILSAKYWLLELEQEIEPYELTLNDLSAAKQRVWARTALRMLRRKADLQSDRFVILAGDSYRKYLLPKLVNFDIPMKGLSFGEQLHWLKEHLE